MTKEEIYNKVIAVICEKGKVNMSSLSLNTNFQNDLGLNSMRLVESIVEVEETFNVEIPDRQLGQILTIGNLVDFLNEKLNKNKR